jgi:hypothetical protein
MRLAIIEVETEDWTPILKYHSKFKKSVARLGAFVDVEFLINKNGLIFFYYHTFLYDMPAFLLYLGFKYAIKKNGFKGKVRRLTGKEKIKEVIRCVKLTC